MFIFRLLCPGHFGPYWSTEDQSKQTSWCGLTNHCTVYSVHYSPKKIDVTCSFFVFFVIYCYISYIMLRDLKGTMKQGLYTVQQFFLDYLTHMVPAKVFIFITAYILRTKPLKIEHLTSGKLFYVFVSPKYSCMLFPSYSRYKRHQNVLTSCCVT